MLYQLAEQLIALRRARSRLARLRHLTVVARVIGDEVVGTQGTPVELLGGLSSTGSSASSEHAREPLTQLVVDAPLRRHVSLARRGRRRSSRS